jgi:hypothetical protein
VNFLFIDIDECATGKHKCPDEKVCVNSVGGYECVCKPGYNVKEVGDGTAVCVKNGTVFHFIFMPKLVH